MSPETLITILSFAVAIYALLPLERVLDLKIKFAWYDLMVVATAIALVLYILYQPVLQTFGFVLDLGPWRWGFDASLTTFSIIVGALLWVFLRLRFGGLRRQRIQSFSRLATDLLHKRKTGELAELLRRYLPELMTIYENNYVFVRLRHWLAPSTWQRFVQRQHPSIGWPKPVRIFARALSRLLPTHERSRDCARETVHRILLSDPFVETVATAYPYLAMDVLKYDVREAAGFQEKWFRCVLDDRHSILFAEIRRNQTNRPGAYHRYDYDPENRCLWFYFHDVRTAERLRLYKSIGDYLCADYGKRRRNPDSDRFNQPLDRYHDVGIWQCPAYAVIRLFDYMVTEALHQGIPWHMWLHYLPIFADKIVLNLDPREDVDLQSEFPTPYHYQLYEIVDVLCKWIASGQDAPEYQDEQAIERAIPMQSVIALGRVMNTVLLTPTLAGRLASDTVESVVRRVDDWRSEPRLEVYRTALIETLAKGGRNHGVPDHWPAILRQHLEDVDVIRYHRTQEAIAAAIDAHWDGHDD